MANQHGGYRPPADPAPVSGPGALSQRTDGAPARMTVKDLPYGQAGQFNDTQSAAPLSADQPQQPPVQMPTPMSAPSQNPNEPVTAGASVGAGASPQDIGLQTDAIKNLKQTLGPFIPTFMRMADAATSTPEFRQQVRLLLSYANR